MIFKELSLKGAYLIETVPFKDSRGIFERLFCESEFQKINHNKKIVQINHTVNKKKGIVRGMHFQYPPKSEIKIVKCLVGAIFDVIVDLRKDSPTFLKWHGEILTEDNQKIMYIPEGFAHGFQTLEDRSDLLYLHSEFYNKEMESGIRFDEPLVGIIWKNPITDISDRDKNHPYLNSDFKGIVL